MRIVQKLLPPEFNIVTCFSWNHWILKWSLCSFAPSWWASASPMSKKCNKNRKDKWILVVELILKAWNVTKVRSERRFRIGSNVFTGTLILNLIKWYENIGRTIIQYNFGYYATRTCSLTWRGANRQGADGSKEYHLCWFFSRNVFNVRTSWAFYLSSFTITLSSFSNRSRSCFHE